MESVATQPHTYILCKNNFHALENYLMYRYMYQAQIFSYI